jgi:hypothetical protein
MAHTFEELKGKTVTELREIAKGIGNEAVQGYTQLNKDHLLAALCKALNIDMHAHHHVVGVDKTVMKAQIKALKENRDEALVAHDHAKLRQIRRAIHYFKRRLHKATI